MRHLHRSAHRHPRFPHMQQLPSIYQHFRPMRILLPPRPQRKPTHTRNTRQRFPAKPKSPHAIQVRRLPYLARGMPLQRQQRIIPAHPMPIVIHPNQRFPPIPKLHLHPRRPRIQTILHQLLHHRHRPLHHFPRGNLVGYPVW